MIVFADWYNIADGQTPQTPKPDQGS